MADCRPQCAHRNSRSPGGSFCTCPPGHRHLDRRSGARHNRARRSLHGDPSDERGEARVAKLAGPLSSTPSGRIAPAFYHLQDPGSSSLLPDRTQPSAKAGRGPRRSGRESDPSSRRSPQEQEGRRRPRKTKPRHATGFTRFPATVDTFLTAFFSKVAEALPSTLFLANPTRYSTPRSSRRSKSCGPWKPPSSLTRILARGKRSRRRGTTLRRRPSVPSTSLETPERRIAAKRYCSASSLKVRKPRGSSTRCRSTC